MYTYYHFFRIASNPVQIGRVDASRAPPGSNGPKRLLAPLVVARITRIAVEGPLESLVLTVQVFYRPHDTRVLTDAMAEKVGAVWSRLSS
jgi:hypothetical protein